MDTEYHTYTDYGICSQFRTVLIAGLMAKVVNVFSFAVKSGKCFPSLDSCLNKIRCVFNDLRF